MNFILGILLFITVILIIFNFTSISISDKPNSNSCSNQNYLFSSNKQTTTQQIPRPITSKSSNNKDALATKQPVYDYNKYFFVKSTTTS
jgi:hypothetical protein